MKINAIPPRDLLYQNVHIKDRQPISYKTQIERDQVEITGEAKTFSTALKAAREQMELPTANQDRIAAIKVQIDNHTYHVPGQDVAAKILGE